ncbi:hypothetical protein L596_025977 [Steinernema carpocapsae]|uniref:Uncharacterized protein n=1 Tax=Steinernema carpocapsae TaxID=34508 RepID=A0A4U5M004_STECR|nr:hypothetical protein L596_025977 [Steinernema carpocapsae]
MFIQHSHAHTTAPNIYWTVFAKFTLHSCLLFEKTSNQSPQLSIKTGTVFAKFHASTRVCYLERQSNQSPQLSIKTGQYSKGFTLHSCLLIWKKDKATISTAFH